MLSRSLLLCAAVVLVAGCFAPVTEGSDGGADGGVADGGGGGSGGGGGGGSGGCSAPADCGTQDAGIGFCGTFSGFSCIDGQCLKECEAPRTCTTDLDAGCVTCAGSMRACRAAGCLGAAKQGRVETSSCLTWPGTLDAMPGSTVQLSGAQCRYAFSRGNGLQVGTVVQLTDGHFLADLPSLGSPCTGSGLPTGVERWAFNCGSCQFVIAFF